jgi:hypothetical protein
MPAPLRGSTVIHRRGQVKALAGYLRADDCRPARRPMVRLSLGAPPDGPGWSGLTISGILTTPRPSKSVQTRPPSAGLCASVSRSAAVYEGVARPLANICLARRALRIWSEASARCRLPLAPAAGRRNSFWSRLGTRTQCGKPIGTLEPRGEPGRRRQREGRSSQVSEKGRDSARPGPSRSSNFDANPIADNWSQCAES